MTEFGIIDNGTHADLVDVLKTGLADSETDRVRIAVGYLYMSGLERLRPELDQFFEDGGRLQILIGNQRKRGLEDFVTAHNDTRLARNEFQESRSVKWSRRSEVRSDVATDYSEQVLYDDPSANAQRLYLSLADWMRSDQLDVRLYLNERLHAKAYLFERSQGDVFAPTNVGIVGSSNLSLSGLQSNTELNAPVYNERVVELKEWFDELWDDGVPFDEDLLSVIDDSWVVKSPGYHGREFTIDDTVTGDWRNPVVEQSERGLPAPYLVYVKTLYELYKETLETAEDYVQSFDVYEDLYEFQRWAVNRGIRIVNEYGGVLVSDVVGMGKTFVGLGLLEHFHARNRLRGNGGKMLIVCPKHLQPMWERMVRERYNLNAEVISLGMVSKEGYSNVLLDEHDDTTVCLIDEAHHFRNDNTNRYENLQTFLPVVNQTILLTATPYTKSAWDVYNQLKLFHIEDVTSIPINPPNIQDFVSEVEDGNRDLSELLSHIMVRRTRQDIVEEYGHEDERGREYLEMGDERRYLPDRHLQTEDYGLHETYVDEDGISLYSSILDTIEKLTFVRYSLGQSDYLRPEFEDQEPYSNLSSMGRSIRGLMKSNLLKRLESSLPAFYDSLERMLGSHQVFRRLLEDGIIAVGGDLSELINSGERVETILSEVDRVLEDDEQAIYEPKAFYIDELKTDLEHDIELLAKLKQRLEPFYTAVRDNPKQDDKAEQFRQIISNLWFGSHDVLRRGDSANKIIVFTQFADTAKYLGESLNEFQRRDELPEDLTYEVATGDSTNVERTIQRFAPDANGARDGVTVQEEIDILLATDVAGEGVNLQDANTVINYDLHWNPLRLIQRIGRVDRLGSEHDDIYAVNFLPETELEEALGIVERVERRVEEIGRVLGEDGKILSPEDNINRKYMQKIYQEADFEEVETGVNEILGSDDLAGPASDLRELRQKHPDLLEWLEDRDGIRTSMNWDQPHDAVVIVYRQGEYATPYLVTFKNGEASIESEQKDEIVQTVSCALDEPVATVDQSTFTDRYERAARTARQAFIREMGERLKFQRESRRGGSADRQYVVDELDKIIDEVDNREQRETLQRYRSIVQTTSAGQVIDEFGTLRQDEVAGDDIVDAVVEIITRYNLEDQFEERREWANTQDEPPHVVVGLYLRGD